MALLNSKKTETSVEILQDNTPLEEEEEDEADDTATHDSFAFSKISAWQIGVGGIIFIMCCTVFTFCHLNNEEYCSTERLTQWRVFQILLVLFLVILWWTQRHRTAEVRKIISRRLPRFTRLPSIVIKIEHHDSSQSRPSISCDYRDRRGMRDPCSPCRSESSTQGSRMVMRPEASEAIGKSTARTSWHMYTMGNESTMGDDFVSCYGDGEANSLLDLELGGSPRCRLGSGDYSSASDNFPDEKPLFGNCPEAQRINVLKSLGEQSERKQKDIRKLSLKIRSCDSDVCRRLRDMGVKDPYAGIEEFGACYDYDRGSYRFLVSAEWDPALAETLIIRCITWRILELPGYMKDLSHLKQMINDRHLPNVGFDHMAEASLAYDESPLEYWKLSLVDLAKSMKKMGKKSFKIGYIQYLESREKTIGYWDSFGVTAIMDCESVDMVKSMWQIPQFRELAKLASGFGEPYYPDSITKCIVCNAPSFIQSFWNLARTVISSGAREKVSIVKGRELVQEFADVHKLNALIKESGL